MATFLLITGTFLLIYAYSIHTIFLDERNFLYSKHPRSRILWIMPTICGLILPVIAWSYIINWHWIILFIANLFFANALASIFKKLFISIYEDSSLLLKKRKTALTLGLSAFILGILLQ